MYADPLGSTPRGSKYPTLEVSDPQAIKGWTSWKQEVKKTYTYYIYIYIRLHLYTYRFIYLFSVPVCFWDIVLLNGSCVCLPVRKGTPPADNLQEALTVRGRRTQAPRESAGDCSGSPGCYSGVTASNTEGMSWKAKSSALLLQRSGQHRSSVARPISSSSSLLSCCLFHVQPLLQSL